MNKKNIALICARGGSKGLPGKNLKILGDKSLVGHAVDLALNCQSISKVFVSTECKKIAEDALNYGAEVPFLRDSSLAKDNSPEWDVWVDAINKISGLGIVTDALVILAPTAPLRSIENVEEAIKLFHSKDCDGVISVTDAHRNPYFNMVKVDNSGRAKIAITGDKQFNRRQDAPLIYDITTVCYVMKPEYILKNSHLFDGKILCNKIPIENSIDIDTNYDFMLAKAIMNWSK